MNKLVCDVCGGNLVMQAGGQVGICSCCGLNYSLDRMREIASGIKVSQTGSAEDVEQWRELVNTYYASASFDDAEKIVKKILEALPSDQLANQQYQELQVLKYFDIRNGIVKGYSGSASSITIPAVITEFDDAVFSGNEYLEEVRIPNGIVRLSKKLFFNCKRLHKVVLPESLLEIDDSAFDGCVTLEQIKIPAWVTKIGECAFRNCASLKEIILPQGITAIEDGTFSGCANLTEIQIPNRVKELGQDGSVSTYGDWDCSTRKDEVIGAFSKCSSLKRVLISSNESSLKLLGSKTFGQCSNLKIVNLPESLTTICCWAFYGCTSLQNITIPESVTVIQGGSQHDSYGNWNHYPWAGCNNLGNVKYPDRFDYGVFEGTEYYRMKVAQIAAQKKRESDLKNGICPDCGGRISSWSSKCKKCGRQFRIQDGHWV